MNWLKQTSEPLFPDVLWSRPENKRHSGKLLVIGGHAQEFNEVSAAYSAAAKAGAGTVRVVLPDALQKTLKSVFPEAEYAPSTPIGSFSRLALDSLTEAASWADAVLLAGGFGRNSETAVLLESFVSEYPGPLGIAGDGIDYFFGSGKPLLERDRTVITAEIGQLQKLAQSQAAIKQNSDLATIIRQLSVLAAAIKPAVITEHAGHIITTYQQQVSTTAVKQKTYMTVLAAYATVWQMQQPQHPFEALSSAVYYFLNDA